MCYQTELINHEDIHRLALDINLRGQEIESN